MALMVLKPGVVISIGDALVRTYLKLASIGQPNNQVIVVTYASVSRPRMCALDSQDRVDAAGRECRRRRDCRATTVVETATCDGRCTLHPVGDLVPRQRMHTCRERFGKDR